MAVRPSGNVYAYEAVQELNIKPKFMKDLLTDQPFTRKDIIHIQDPMNLEASACMLQLELEFSDAHRTDTKANRTMRSDRNSYIATITM